MKRFKGISVNVEKVLSKDFSIIKFDSLIELSFQYTIILQKDTAFKVNPEGLWGVEVISSLSSVFD